MSGFLVLNLKRTSIDLPWGFRLKKTSPTLPSFVTRINKSSQAEFSGLKSGDRFIEVNGIDVVHMSCSDVMEVMRQCGNDVPIVVARESSGDKNFQENQLADINDDVQLLIPPSQTSLPETTYITNGKLSNTNHIYASNDHNFSGDVCNHISDNCTSTSNTYNHISGNCTPTSNTYSHLSDNCTPTSNTYNYISDNYSPISNTYRISDNCTPTRKTYHHINDYYTPTSNTYNHLSDNCIPTRNTYNYVSDNYTPTCNTYNPISNNCTPTSNTYNHISDNCAPTNNTYNHLSDNYTPTCNTYNHISDNYTPTCNTYNHISDNCTPTRNTYHNISDNYTPTSNTYHISDYCTPTINTCNHISDDYTPTSNTYNHNSNNYTSTNDTYKHTSDTYNPINYNYNLPSDNYNTPSDNHNYSTDKIVNHTSMNIGDENSQNAVDPYETYSYNCSENVKLLSPRSTATRGYFNNDQTFPSTKDYGIITTYQTSTSDAAPGAGSSDIYQCNDDGIDPVSQKQPVSQTEPNMEKGETTFKVEMEIQSGLIDENEKSGSDEKVTDGASHLPIYDKENEINLKWKNEGNVINICNLYDNNVDQQLLQQNISQQQIDTDSKQEYFPPADYNEYSCDQELYNSSLPNDAAAQAMGYYHNQQENYSMPQQHIIDSSIMDSLPTELQQKLLPHFQAIVSALQQQQQQQYSARGEENFGSTYPTYQYEYPYNAQHRPSLYVQDSQFQNPYFMPQEFLPYAPSDQQLAQLTSLESLSSSTPTQSLEEESWLSFDPHSESPSSLSSFEPIPLNKAQQQQIIQQGQQQCCMQQQQHQQYCMQQQQTNEQNQQLISPIDSLLSLDSFQQLSLASSPVELKQLVPPTLEELQMLPQPLTPELLLCYPQAQYQSNVKPSLPLQEMFSYPFEADAQMFQKRPEIGFQPLNKNTCVSTSSDNHHKYSTPNKLPSQPSKTSVDAIYPDDCLVQPIAMKSTSLSPEVQTSKEIKSYSNNRLSEPNQALQGFYTTPSVRPKDLPLWTTLPVSEDNSQGSVWLSETEITPISLPGDESTTLKSSDAQTVSELKIESEFSNLTVDKDSNVQVVSEAYFEFESDESLLDDKQAEPTISTSPSFYVPNHSEVDQVTNSDDPQNACNDHPSVQCSTFSLPSLIDPPSSNSLLSTASFQHQLENCHLETETAEPQMSPLHNLSAINPFPEAVDSPRKLTREETNQQLLLEESAFEPVSINAPTQKTSGFPAALKQSETPAKLTYLRDLTPSTFSRFSTNTIANTLQQNLPAESEPSLEQSVDQCFKDGRPSSPSSTSKLSSLPPPGPLSSSLRPPQIRSPPVHLPPPIPRIAPRSLSFTPLDLLPPPVEFASLPSENFFPSLDPLMTQTSPHFLSWMRPSLSLPPSPVPPLSSSPLPPPAPPLPSGLLTTTDQKLHIPKRRNSLCGAGTMPELISNLAIKGATGRSPWSYAPDKKAIEEQSMRIRQNLMRRSSRRSSEIDIVTDELRDKLRNQEQGKPIWLQTKGTPDSDDKVFDEEAFLNKSRKPVAKDAEDDQPKSFQMLRKSFSSTDEPTPRRNLRRSSEALCYNLNKTNMETNNNDTQPLETWIYSGKKFPSRMFSKLETAMSRKAEVEEMKRKDQ